MSSTRTACPSFSVVDLFSENRSASFIDSYVDSKRSFELKLFCESTYGSMIDAMPSHCRPKATLQPLEDVTHVYQSEDGFQPPPSRQTANTKYFKTFIAPPRLRDTPPPLTRGAARLGADDQSDLNTMVPSLYKYGYMACIRLCTMVLTSRPTKSVS